MRARRHRSGRRGGILAKLLVACAILFALAALAWMLLLPVWAAHWVRHRTGFDASVQSLMVNPFSGRILARGVAVNNPPTFPRAEFLQIREFEAEARLASLFTDRPVFTRLRLDIGLVALVKRPDGRTNLEVFRGYLAPTVPAGDGRPAEPAPLRIQRLEVRFDRFLIADYSGRQPVVREYPLNLDRTFDNVADPRQLMLPGSLDQLIALSGALGSLLPGELAQAVDQALRSSSDLVRELGRRNPVILDRAVDTLEESKKP